MKLLTELFTEQKEDESRIDYERRLVVGQVFQMCLLTGARIGEIISMRWEQIDFGAKVLQIVGTKTKFKSAKNVRYLSITPTIEQILQTRKTADKFGGFVFSRTRRSVTKYHQILSDTAKLCAAASSHKMQDIQQLRECFKPELTFQPSAK